MRDDSKKRPVWARVVLLLVELVGVALIVAGVAAWSVPAALIVAGAALVGVCEVRSGAPREPVPVTRSVS